MKRPLQPGACLRCGEPPVPVRGEDGRLVPPLVDGVCFFCRMVPKLKRDKLLTPVGQ